MRVTLHVLIIAIVISGCAYNVPPVADSSENTAQSQHSLKKMPIKAGVYLNDELKRYIYQRQNMGATLQMTVGEYVSSIAMTVGSALFDEVIPVNTLPPYDDNDKPDIQAVIKPEILFYDANVVGDFSESIRAKTKLRMTVYDLGGNIIWQDEAIAESRSRNNDFVSNLFGGTKAAGEAGYQAVSAAADKIIGDFYAKPPQEFFDLIDIAQAENLNNQGRLPDAKLFEKLYAKGQSQYDKKKYYQSLNLFTKALLMRPYEPAALFYTGASYTRTGEKAKALKRFAEVIKNKSLGQEAADAKKWIERLNDPLKIGVIDKSNRYESDSRIIQDHLVNTGMYKLVNVAPLLPAKKNSSGFSQFLGKCAQKGVKIIIQHDIDSSTEQVSSNGADVATEQTVKISAKVFSTRKKQLKTELRIIETSSTMSEQTEEERQRLLERGAKRLVLQLLKEDIF
jgi:tetratricopeptide (TPR) repeat protein